jgi:hypothetical protein
MLSPFNGVYFTDIGNYLVDGVVEKSLLNAG